MDTDDIRAAAEAVLGVEPTGAAWEAEPGRLIPAALKCARAWLVEHPADDGEPPNADWLSEVGAVQDPEHPNEWLLPMQRFTAVGEHYQLTVDLSEPMGVCWECIGPNGNTLECPTIIYGGLTRRRLRLLCEALATPLKGT